jgi:hypothetical protein
LNLQLIIYLLFTSNNFVSYCFFYRADKNLMYKQLLMGTLKPKVLVKMESHDMASADLVEWRKKEAEKEIELIKKAELDKIAESKKIRLLEKGVDDAVTVAEESRPMDISEVFDQQHHPSIVLEETKEKESSSSSKSKDKHRDKSRHHSKSEKSSRHHSSSSSRRKDSSSSKSHHHKSSSSSKDKEKEKDKRDKDRHVSDHHKAKDKDSKESGNKEAPTESLPSTTPLSNSEDIVTTTSSTFKSSLPEQEIVEQEQPSTIKTPDFIIEDKKDTISTVASSSSSSSPSEQNYLFQTKVMMPGLGSFHASVHNVSHSSPSNLDGKTFFPKSPVPVVGRISPDTVWDYINKVKKSKDILVFRLSPAAPIDSEGYMEFFKYFSSRERIGVIGGIESPLKDVYLVPLPKQAPVPKCLPPFVRGPGLPVERTHCLLCVCVVTRTIRDPSSSASTSGLSMKRKASISIDKPIFGGAKRVKLDADLPVRN